MLERIRLENFKSHAATELQVGALTILVGPNGSGKTSILRAIHAASLLPRVPFDDLEQGLHPRAQQELIAVVKESIQQYPGLQIVATSHSPYLVDEVAPRDVWVTALRDDDSTACRRLSDQPDAERALEVLTSGEFLSAEGEDWLLAEHGS